MSLSDNKQRFSYKPKIFTYLCILQNTTIFIGFEHNLTLDPSPGDLPDPGTEPWSLTSPAPAGRFFTTGATREAQSTLGNDF